MCIKLNDTRNKYEDNKYLKHVVELDVCDWDRDHICIEYEKGLDTKNGNLTIRGESKTAYSNGGVYQSFFATFSLPSNIDYSIEPWSKLENNKLTITFTLLVKYILHIIPIN